jgi:hypothetical protein
VISPSAHPPTQRAVAADTAAPISIGGVAGSVHNRAWSTVTRPRCVTVDAVAGGVDVMPLVAVVPRRETWQ